MRIEEALDEMREIICETEKAPILFIGSGLSRRYFGTPDWKGLLQTVASKVGLGEFDTEQWGTLQEQATVLEYYAFSAGLKEGEKGRNRRIPLRKVIQEIILGQNTIFPEKKQEVAELAKVVPKAIITTNYDRLLEDIFGDSYDSCVGQEDFLQKKHGDYNTIYKIHGCVSKPSTIVITAEDYDKFMKKSKYLYAKMMTLFCENPIVFMGYSISDGNVMDILDNMLTIMTEEEKKVFLKRVWILSYKEGDGEEYFEEKEINIDRHKIAVKRFCLDQSYYRFYQTLAEASLRVYDNRLKFSISDNAIDLLISPLYQKQDKFQVVIRELLQNAQDACKIANRDVNVAISLITEEKSVKLRISDCGIGMDWQDVRKYFLVIGNSSKAEEDCGLTGKFGIGILSIFLVGNEATVYSRKESSVVGFRIFEEAKEKKIETIYVDDSVFEEGRISTIVEVKLIDEVSSAINNAGKFEDVIRLMGLNDYYTWDNSRITITYKEDKRVIEKFKTEGMHKVEEDFYIEKLYEDNSKYAQLKGKALINDMIVKVSFNTLNTRMVKNTDIPFFAIRTKNKSYSGNVLPNLSRSEVEIEGELKNKIVSYLYNEEAEKLIVGIEELVRKKESEQWESGIEEYDEKKKVSARDFRFGLIPECKLLRNQRVSYQGQCIALSEEWKKIICVYRSRKAFEEIATVQECDFRDVELNKSYLADMIENGRIIGIGKSYLYKYIIHATGSYDGFRMVAVDKVLKKIGITNANYKNAKDMWSSITRQSKAFGDHLEKYLQQDVLWFDQGYRHLITSGIPLCNMVITKEYKESVAPGFLKILENRISDKPNIREYIIPFKQV